VIDRDNDYREGAEEIETRLALAMRKTRIDSGRKRSEIRSQRSDAG
jgi:hypothetical protein